MKNNFNKSKPIEFDRFAVEEEFEVYGEQIMTYKEKIELARKHQITIKYDLLNSDNVVGIYKFFKVKGAERYCFYIGKATDVAFRLLGASKGHIYMFLNENYSKLVPREIKKYLEDGYEIEVEIEEKDYKDTCFSRAVHRLALAELEEIVKYQEKGQCLLQTPEGVGKREKKFWEQNYKE